MFRLSVTQVTQRCVWNEIETVCMLDGLHCVRRVHRQRQVDACIIDRRHDDAAKTEAVEAKRLKRVWCRSKHQTSLRV
jgi:hypothetical protein